jgi:hypothetical protein
MVSEPEGLTPGIVNFDSLCMYTVNDSEAAIGYSPQASEMGWRFTCRAVFQRRSRGPQSDTSAGRRPDQPSAGSGVWIAAKSLSDSPPGWWTGHPSARRPPEATGQGVLRALQVKVVATGREPARPASPSSPRAVGRCEALRAGLARSRTAPVAAPVLHAGIRTVHALWPDDCRDPRFLGGQIAGFGRIDARKAGGIVAMHWRQPWSPGPL